MAKEQDVGAKIEGRSGSRAIDELRTEIELTRNRAAETINEIERRLSLDSMMDRFKGRAQQIMRRGKVNTMANQSGETSRRLTSTLLDTIKDHPLPSMMIGGGLAWLIAGSFGSRQSEEKPNFYERRQSAGVDETGTYGIGFIERRRSVLEEAQDDDSRRTAKIKSGLQSRTRTAREKSRELGEQAREKTSQAAARVKEKLSGMRESTSEYGQRARQSFSRGDRDVRGGLTSAIENHPLAVAGLMLAAGAVAGLVIPESRFEDEKMGQSRDQMMNSAREAGRETVQKAQSVAREAVEAAKDEAEKQGLVQREQADRAEQKAKSAAEEARERTEEGYGRTKEKADEKMDQF